MKRNFASISILLSLTRETSAFGLWRNNKVGAHWVEHFGKETITFENIRKVRMTNSLLNSKNENMFALDDNIIGEYCSLIKGEDGDCLNDIAKEKIEAQANSMNLIDKLIVIIPAIIPVCAYFTYDAVRIYVNYFSQTFSNNNWEAVDGRVFQTSIMTPAINGIVVPTVSILFATISGNTINTLRERQQKIRTLINTEANELRTLQSYVDSYPTIPLNQQSKDELRDFPYANGYSNLQIDGQDVCRLYLIQYTARLIKESKRDSINTDLEFKGSLESEMNGFLKQLNEIQARSNSEKGKKTEASSISPLILMESYGAISRLNSYRSSRISALQSTFPLLHYGILVALGSSICVAFLMETNQEVIYFMNATELRLLWTMLIGTLAALGVVCYDMSEPFGGSYQILSSVDQLYIIIEFIRASERMKRDQQEVIKTLR